MSNGIVRTARGKQINMNQLREANQKTVAVTGGGHKMNARGDLIGKGGKIIKSNEQREAEVAQEEAYNATSSTVKQVSIKKQSITADMPTTIKNENDKKTTAKKAVEKEQTEAVDPAESAEVQELDLDEAVDQIEKPKTSTRRKTSTKANTDK